MYLDFELCVAFSDIVNTLEFSFEASLRIFVGVFDYREYVIVMWLETRRMSPVR